MPILAYCLPCPQVCGMNLGLFALFISVHVSVQSAQIQQSLDWISAFAEFQSIRGNCWTPQRHYRRAWSMYISKEGLSYFCTGFAGHSLYREHFISLLLLKAFCRLVSCIVYSCAIILLLFGSVELTTLGF